MAVKNAMLILVLLVPIATGGLAYSGTEDCPATVAYVSHAAIEINGDSDLVSQAAVEGWPGDGSESSPYVIEGLSIEAFECCISATSVSLYLEIRNCRLTTVSDYQDCIYFFDVSNALVESCILTSTNGGVQLGYIHHLIFRDNVVRGGRNALSLWGCSQSSFINNTFCDGGLSMWPMDISELMNEFVNNTVREGELGYFLNVTGKTIDATAMGQVILANCRNVTVNNGQFAETGSGAYVLFSTDCTIQHSEVCGSDFAIHIRFSDGTRLLHNKIVDASYMGILVNTSSDCVITGNEIYSGGYSGIELSDSANVLISNNQISNCWTGMTIFLTDGGIVTGNRFIDNQEYGARLYSDATNYTLFNNTFILNNVSNVRDDGSGNVWDDGVGMGNRWDDYGGYGVYNIIGTAESVDRYPIGVNATVPEFAPWISHPHDMTYPFGETGNAITWHVVASEPTSFSVSQDGQIILSDVWDSLPVTVEVDYLSSGYYNFTIVVLDKEGYSAFDTVMVHVYTVPNGTLPTSSTTTTATTTTTTSSTMPTNITTTDTIGGLEKLVSQMVTIGSVCVIVVVVVLIIRTRPENASMGWGT